MPVIQKANMLLRHFLLLALSPTPFYVEIGASSLRARRDETTSMADRILVEHGASNLRASGDETTSPSDRTLVENDEFVNSSADRALVNEDEIPTPVGRIVNGDSAIEGRFPYYVSIYAESWWGPPKHTCGGTLIARDIVLCAAHCYDPRDPPTKVRVGAYTESDYRNYNGNQPFHDAKILNVIPHPRFNMNSMDFDVALFRIEPVTDRELIRSIVKIDYTGRVDRNLESYDSLHVIGLGRLRENGPLAETLQEVELKYLQNCNRYFRWPGTITSQMMCAADNREDSCQGDSGGPLFVKGRTFMDDVQVGIVSWGAGGCAAGSPGVYARISSVAGWIKQEICRNSRYPPSDLCPNRISDESTNDDESDTDSGLLNPPLQVSSPTPAPPSQRCRECFWIFCWEVTC